MTEVVTGGSTTGVAQHVEAVMPQAKFSVLTPRTSGRHTKSCLRTQKEKGWRGCAGVRGWADGMKLQAPWRTVCNG